MSSALLYLHDRFFGDSPTRRSELEEARGSWQVANLAYSLRQEAGLTQRELAARIGTGASVICRLENDEYRGQALAMLRRVATEFGRRVEVRLVADTTES